MDKTQKTTRRRDLSLKERAMDWVLVGKEMLDAAAKHSPPDFVAGRRAVMQQWGLGDSISRKIIRMAEHLRRYEISDPKFARLVARTTTAPAEVLLRWAQFDRAGALEAARQWHLRQHTIGSLIDAERAARASSPAHFLTFAPIEFERRALEELANDPAFSGWTIERATRAKTELAGLDTTLPAAGVDAIAKGPNGEKRVIIIMSSVREDRTSAFSRSVVAAVWLAKGIASSQAPTWLLVISREEHRDAIDLASRLSSDGEQITVRVMAVTVTKISYS